jgi:nucleotide-binding universal stress UspA family protein
MATVDAPFSDILVPLDGSAAAERALRPALDLAARTGVRLRALRRALSDHKEATEYLAAVADRCAPTTDLPTHVVDRESIPDAIIEELEPGTLVCMSSHGRGGLARAVIGSVAEALLRSLDRPVLVVGPHHVEAAAFSGRIVACIDGSDESCRTLAPARQWAGTLGLPLWLMEVIEPGVLPEWVDKDDVVEASHVAALAADLDGVAGWDVLHDTDPARALVTMARSPSTPTGLLVMATHGRSGWDRLRLGSVTIATVHAATVPVLVVPAASPAGTRAPD